MLENCSSVIRQALTQNLMFNSLKRGTQRRLKAVQKDVCPTLEHLEDRSLLSAGDLFVAELPQTTLINDDALAPGLSGLLTEASTGDPLDIGLSYIRDNAASLGLTPTDLEDGDFNVTNLYKSQHNGVTHVYTDQVHNGRTVLNADLSFAVTADGRIVSVHSSFLTGLDGAGTAETPTISAVDGYKSVAEYFSLTFTSEPGLVYDTDGTADLIANAGAALEDVPFELQYAPAADGTPELAWRMNIQTVDHWYDVAVSAVDGEILQAGDWVARASYTALSLPAESPGEGTFITLVDPQDPTASPFGWHDTDGIAGAEFTDTRGNNAFVQEDQDGDNAGGARPDGGAALVFDFSYDDTQAPTTNIDAASTNLFVQNNVLHDILYQYGFDEASGNFQQNNYGNGGLGGDAVLVDSLDPSFFGPNFGTPPDGTAPRMEMTLNALFTTTTPVRDSAFANFITAHEFGHGLSNRLTGGAADTSALFAAQSRGMGEGWSDFLGLMMVQNTSDQQFDAYSTGNWFLGNPLNDPAGGIRDFPYSFDMSISPKTYGDYNQLVGGAPHPIGEIIAATMWDLNWLMINGDGLNIPGRGFDPDLYNGTGGNNTTMQLFMDGLKLQPAFPTFVQYRDAVLLADEINSGGANQLAIWTAFARRGIGFSADDGGSADAPRVTEAFDLPPIFLELDLPTEIFENEAQTFVSVTRPVLLGLGSDLVVSLASSDTSELTVPAQVTIPAGQTRVSFAMTVVDDTSLDGDQRVAITANAAGFITEQQVVTVKDHETLTVDILADEIREIDGTAATTATLTRSNTTVDTTANILVSQFNALSEYSGDGVFLTSEDIVHGSQSPIEQRLFSTTFSSDILEINPQNGAIINSFAPPNAFGEAMAWDGEVLWWNSGGGTILELDPDSGLVLGTHNVPSPTSFNSGLAFLNGYLYISNWGATSNGVTVFDPDTDTVIRTLNLDVINNGLRVAFVGGIAAITTGGDDALLVSATINNQDVIAEIDPFTGRIENRFNRSNDARGLAVVNGEVFAADVSDQPIVVTDRAGNTLRTIDPSRFFSHHGLAGDDAAEGYRHERETARDVIVTANYDVAIYDGTEDVYLTTRPITGSTTWNYDASAGLSSSGPLSGGIASLDNFIFMSDEATDPGTVSGIVRFDTTTGTNQRFETSTSYIDLIAGWDGRLYGLADNGRQIDSFDKDTMVKTSSIVLSTAVKGIAVNRTSQIFAVDGSAIVRQHNSTGTLLKTFDTGVDGLFDIDTSVEGDTPGAAAIVIGSEFGRIVTTTEDLTDSNSFFAARPGEPAFVAFSSPVIPGSTGGSLPALTVVLTNSDASEINIPLTITIPAGQQSVEFDMDAVDDLELDGTQTVVVGAFDQQYVSVQDTVDVLDIEEIFIDVVADEVSEFAGEDATTVRITRSAIDGPFTFASSHHFENYSPTTIIDNTTVTSNIEVPAQFGRVTDVNITLDIDHRYIGDLVAVLVSPTGTEIELFSRVGNNGRQFSSTLFDDESFNPVINGVSPFSGDYRPEQPLSAIDGENPAGTWGLKITDHATRDVGILDGWELDFTMLGLPELQVLVQSNDVSEAIVPQLVTIPINQGSIVVSLDAIDDGILDGPQPVTVTGSIPGSSVWLDGDDLVNVTDYETLLLSINPGSVKEDAGLGGVSGTISRNNIDLTQPLVVTLSSSDTTAANVPTTVTIPAGLASLTFPIDVVDDTLLDGTQTATITATNSQYAADATADLEVLDKEPILVVLLNETEVFENRAFITGRVQRLDSVSLNTTLVVTLTTSDASEATVPTTVTIPPLATQAAFRITIVDDNILDGPQDVLISATAANVTTGTATLTVLDYEEISFTVTASSFTENAGAEASILRITRPTGTNAVPLVVNLTSSDTTELTVPATTVIPADKDFVDVAISAVNDSEVDGTQNVTITIAAEGFIQAEVPIAVLDHEPPLLTGPELRTKTARPEFTWEAVTGATGYDLWLTNLSTGEAQLLREPNLGANVLAYTPSINLSVGRYRYWVRAKGATEVLGAWSAGRTFSVTSQPTITSPIRVASTNTVEYQWSAVAAPNVTYKLWLRDLTNNVDQLLLVDGITTTTYTATEVLDPGLYRVWVQATSADGVVGDWSQGATFSYLPTPTIIDLPTSTFDRTQLITWNATGSASHYEISIRNNTTGQSNFILDRFVQGTPGEATVSYRPVFDLPDGEYRIFVRAVNSNGVASAWSPAQTMQVGGSPVVTGPVGIIGGIGTFTWTAVNAADNYELWVTKVGGSRVIHVPNATSTSYTNITALESGDYRVWVRAFSERGEATIWGESLDFSVASNTPANGMTPQINKGSEAEAQPLMFAKFETTLASEQLGTTPAAADVRNNNDEPELHAPAEQTVPAEVIESIEEVESVDSLMVEWPASNWWDTDLDLTDDDAELVTAEAFAEASTLDATATTDAPTVAAAVLAGVVAIPSRRKSRTERKRQK